MSTLHPSTSIYSPKLYIQLLLYEYTSIYSPGSIITEHSAIWFFLSLKTCMLLCMTIIIGTLVSILDFIILLAEFVAILFHFF